MSDPMRTGFAEISAKVRSRMRTKIGRQERGPILSEYINHDGLRQIFFRCYSSLHHDELLFRRTWIFLSPPSLIQCGMRLAFASFRIPLLPLLVVHVSQNTSDVLLRLVPYHHTGC